MRARHPEAAGRAACPRCAALLRPGAETCSLCGWTARSRSEEPATPARDVEQVPPNATTLDAPAMAQLEALDAINEQQGGGEVSAAPAAPAPARTAPTTDHAVTPTPLSVTPPAAVRELDPLTAPLALLTGDPAALPGPDALPRDTDLPGAGDASTEAPAEDSGPHGPSSGPVTPSAHIPVVVPARPPGRGSAVRPVRRTADVVVALSALVGGLAVVRAGLVGWVVSDGGSGPAGPGVDAVLAAALLAAAAGLALTFLLWVARARANAEAQSPVPQRRSPTMAVVGWFIPVAGLFIGWQVLQDLWTAADPATRDDPASRPAEPLLVTGWLAGLAVSSVVWLAGAVVLGGSPLVDIVSALALAASVGCLGLAVRTISRWQDPADEDTAS